jgi:TRAP-type C4-dicarboxylate transport system permease small subunit
MTQSSPEPAPLEHLVDVVDEPAPPLSTYAVEDWFAFAFFWVLAIVVFLQFFTRYVLNDSLAWTEEIARYLLICVCFVGSGAAVRKSSHILVEFFYVYLPRGVAWPLSLFVDWASVAFYGFSTYLTWLVADVMRTQQMVVIDWPLSYVYWIVMAGFVWMTVRAVQVALRNYKAGDSALTRVAMEGRHQ